MCTAHGANRVISTFIRRFLKGYRRKSAPNNSGYLYFSDVFYIRYNRFIEDCSENDLSFLVCFELSNIDIERLIKTLKDIALNKFKSNVSIA